MNEIYLASLLPLGKGSSIQGDPVNVDKLLAKALQFFPNIKLSRVELEQIAPKDLPAFLENRLSEAITEKKAAVDSATSWAFVGFFRYLALVQMDESWCKHLSRLDLLKEEMVLQSFTSEKDVMDTYRERALLLFETLMDDVRRNTVYSLFVYNTK